MSREQLLGKRSLLEWGCGGAGLKCFVCAKSGVSGMWLLVSLSCVAACSCKQRVWGLSKHQTNVVHMGKEQQQGLHAASILKNQIKENPEC